MSFEIDCGKFCKEKDFSLVAGAASAVMSAGVATLCSATGLLTNVTISQGLLFGATFGVVFSVTWEVLGCLSITGNPMLDNTIYVVVSTIIAGIAASLLTSAVLGSFAITTGLAIGAASNAAIAGLLYVAIFLLPSC